MAADARSEGTCARELRLVLFFSSQSNLTKKCRTDGNTELLWKLKEQPLFLSVRVVRKEINANHSINHNPVDASV